MADGPVVYLSYSQENESYALPLRNALADMAEIGALMDTSSTRADITRALGTVDVVICMLGTTGSGDWEPSTWQKREILAADELGRPVIPVLVEGPDHKVELSGALRYVPDGRITMLRRGSWDADARAIAALASRLAADAPEGVDMLPRGSDFFFGRHDELARIDQALQDTGGGAPRTVVITGPPGVGKSSLATVAADRVAPRFPDGRLYASFARTPDVATALREFLQALGVAPDVLPAEPDRLAAVYQSMLRQRRILVVLDDVEHATDIRPLLPPGPPSAALIVSRYLPGTLEHTTVIALGGMDEATALAILRKAAGTPVVEADEASARALIHAVDGLPQALRLAASRARRAGDSSLAAVLARLETTPSGRSATPQRLMEQAYDGLTDPQRRLFRLLGALPTPAFEAGLAAALAADEAEVVAGALRTLADSALIDTAGPDHYRLSDLTARFAANRLRDTDSEADRQAAFERAVRWLAVRTAFRPEMPITRDFWTADDTLGYAPYADAIAAFVRHRGTRPPLTIGVTAPWGAGKTSLMRMVQERLDPRADRERWKPTSLRLSEEARRALVPPARAADRPVTNRELLQRTTEPSIDADDVDPRRLDVQPPHAERLPDAEWRPTVWFNPWMYQSGEQIWAGLAYEIITQVTDRLAPADRERFWLALNLRRVDRQALRRRIYRQLVERFLPWLLWLGLAVTLAVVGLLVAVVFPPIAHAVRVGAAALMSVAGTAFGVAALVTAVRFLGAKASGSFGPLLRVPNPVKAAADQSGKGAKGAYGELFPDPAYQTRLGFLHLVQTDMRRVLDLIATQQRPLVVFVDDLDRCSPGAVVQVIEAINLFLAGEFPNCVFVVAMEPAVVAAHVEAVYKDLAAQPQAGRPAAWSTLGWRFLEKIVQLPLSLPPPNGDRQTNGYLDSLLDQPRGPVPAPEPQPATVASQAPRTAVPDRSSAGGTGPPATVGPSAPNEAGDGDRAARVAQVEAAIRRRSPTTETLAAAALQAQAEVIPGAAGTLLPETSEAANRVLVELYSDSEARTAILAGVPGLASDNPREIKRFVNLFRFYSFIAQQHQLQGLPAVSGAQIAKLSVLAIRWPHLLALLGRRSADGVVTNLGHLEQSLRSAAGTTDAWREATRAIGLPTGGENSTEPLRSFLTTEPAIGSVAGRML
ncbi:P-loop NTPase fold protein [Couchioplanes caeruleus]|uniref:P-loop NTPase fold protein n=1 Tax=Couchioplanes caeruleus TaxID=56438 RepID=UPI0020C12514|nr:P-loop NTPase fold protein [Couchioplanes caeruleus]UQU64473.1 P-loop NTPase fold protein [Couchioplanes caeruleus]